MITAVRPLHMLDALRPTIESIRLAEFAQSDPQDRILEIGCGNGYIALVLACRFPQSRQVVGVDLQPHRIMAAKNAARLLYEHHSPMAPVRFFEGDARSTGFSHTGFDVVACNPPFFPSGSGRPSPHPERRFARQDDTLSLTDLFSCAARRLNRGGRLYFVFPNNRVEEILATHAKRGFTIESNSHLPNIRKRSGGVNLIASRFVGHP